MTIIRFLSAACLATFVFTAPSQPQAAGFYIQEQSVSGLGSAFSGSVTNLNDASTVYFNPAGMTKLPGTQIQGGGHLIIPSADLKDTGSTTPVTGLPISGGDGGNPYRPTPVPNGYTSHQITDDIWVGIGVSAPFGLSNSYDPAWFGRYDSISTDLVVTDIQPSVAYRVFDGFSVGAGVNIQRADAKLTSAAFGGATEGVSTLRGDDWTIGFTAGVQAEPIDGTTLGASYRSAISHDLEGTISVVGSTNADFSVNGHAGLDLPDIATFGVAQEIGEKLTVQGQATWFGWNNFQDIHAITNDAFSILGGAVTRAPGNTVSNVVQNYQTTWAFAAGAEYEHNDKWTFRGGVQFDETPTTDEYRTSRTPDGDRTWISGGASYNLNDKVTIDVAATYIWIAEEEIDVDRNNSFSTAVQSDVIAETEGNVIIGAVGLSYKF